MSKRKKIPDAIVTDILFKSRRRCCLCAFLRGEDSVKKGQIAHLNGNASDNKEDNLAFLCLEHHDEYDGQTSVSKGITPKEIKRYRDLLYTKNDSADMVRRKTPLQQPKAAAGESNEIAIEPYFWLAQMLVAWTSSQMELSWEVFVEQMRKLGLETLDRDTVAKDDYLAQAGSSITDQLIANHGQIAADIFFIGTMVALLPFMFESLSHLRTTKAAIERTVLKTFDTPKALEVTTLFLSDVPCEVPRFVEKIEQYKKDLQQAVAG